MKTRNITMDNLKGLLIFLVVFCHCLYSYTFYNSYSTIFITKFIYIFHMPLFFIVSGYFSKEVNKKNLFNILFLFLLINYSFVIYDYVISGNFNVLLIKYSSWYLLYLFIYRIIIQNKYISVILNKYKNISIISVFILSILSGFIFNFFISRLLSFFCFFIFGFLYKKNIMKINKILNILIIFLIFFMFCLVCYNLSFDLNYYMGFYYYNILEFLFRPVIYILIIILFCLLVNVIPNKNIIFITRFGRNSLYIYLFHRILCFIINYIFYSNKYYALISLLFSFIICIVFSFSIFKNIVIKLLELLYKFFCSYRYKFLVICFFIFILSIMFQYRNNIYNYFKKVDVISYDEIDELSDSLSIGFVGDLILLENQVKYSYSDGNYNFDYMFNNVKKYFNEVDYMIGVLEGPSDDRKDYSYGNFDDNKKLRLNYPSNFIKSIKNNGIDLVTLSNNHLLDKGVDSAYATIDNLNNNKLDYVGIYNQGEKKNKKVVNIDGKKVGILAYTYGFNYIEEDELFNKYNNITNYLVNSNSKHFKKVKDSVINDFKYLKSKDVDLIIVMPHYGTQFSNEIDNYQKIWNDIFVKNGADIVLGDHSHSVQPILYKNNTVIINSPGNFVNSYVEHDGDISMMVKIFIDKKNNNINAVSVIPLLAVKDNKLRYYSVPVYNYYTNKKQYNRFLEKRFKYANELVTKVSINNKISINNIEPEYFYFPKEGYKKNNKYVFELNDKDKNSNIYKQISNSNSICFIGDSITEGTMNYKHPWYEEINNIFKDKDIYNISKGSYTTFDILNDFSDDISNSSCDLYIINIGTNDIRYHITNERKYMKNINRIISFINNDKSIILLSPFRTTYKDKYLKRNMKQKKIMYDKYDEELKKYADKYDNIYYKDVNRYIKSAIKDNGDDIYLLDGVHPNNDLGVKLYSYALFR